MIQKMHATLVSLSLAPVKSISDIKSTGSGRDCVTACRPVSVVCTSEQSLKIVRFQRTSSVHLDLKNLKGTAVPDSHFRWNISERIHTSMLQLYNLNTPCHINSLHSVRGGGLLRRSLNKFYSGEYTSRWRKKENITNSTSKSILHLLSCRTTSK